MPIETFTRSQTDAERQELVGRREAATGFGESGAALLMGLAWLIISVAAVWLARGLGLSVLGAGVAVGATVAGLTAAVLVATSYVVRPGSSSRQLDAQALQFDLDDGRVDATRVTARAVVVADDELSYDGPWFLFDVGEEQALLVAGREFANVAGFPSTDFEIVRTRWSDQMLDVRCGGQPLSPVRILSSGPMAEAFWFAPRDPIPGPFGDVVARVFGPKARLTDS